MNRNDAESVIKDTIEYANNEIKKSKEKSRRIIIATLVSEVLLIIILGSCFISYATFNTLNPFSVASGYFQISVLDKEYVEIQASPKVVLAQPNGEVFIDYMDSRGFTELEEAQMGAIRVFTNGEEKEWVWYSINENYSKWRWQETHINYKNLVYVAEQSETLSVVKSGDESNNYIIDRLQLAQFLDDANWTAQTGLSRKVQRNTEKNSKASFQITFDGVYLKVFDTDTANIYYEASGKDRYYQMSDGDYEKILAMLNSDATK